MNRVVFAKRARKNKQDAQTIRRIIVAFRPYRTQVYLILTAILFTTLLGLVNPLLVQHLFDDAIGKHNLLLLTVYVVVMIVTPVLSGLIDVGQSYLDSSVGQRVMRDFRNQ